MKKKYKYSRLIYTISIFFSLLFICPTQSQAATFWDYIKRLIGDDVTISKEFTWSSPEPEIQESLQTIHENSYNFVGHPGGDLDLYIRYSFVDDAVSLDWLINAIVWSEYYPVQTCEWSYDEFYQQYRWNCYIDYESCYVSAEADYLIERVVDGVPQQIEYITNGSGWGWGWNYVKGNDRVTFYDSLHDVPIGSTVSYNVKSYLTKYTNVCPSTPSNNYSSSGVLDGDGNNCPDYVDQSLCIDSDGDTYPDIVDVFPNDPTEWLDSDGDGVGNNRDTCPYDPNDWLDTDGDGHCDNADAFPDDPTEWSDRDGDGYGDNSDNCPTVVNTDQLEMDGDGYGDLCDACPNDPNDWLDTDGDGHCNYADSFPNDPTEWIDSDGDGLGNNSDPCPFNVVNVDTDADGICDGSDPWPTDPTLPIAALIPIINYILN